MKYLSWRLLLLGVLALPLCGCAGSIGLSYNLFDGPVATGGGAPMGGGAVRRRLVEPAYQVSDRPVPGVEYGEEISIRRADGRHANCGEVQPGENGEPTRLCYWAQ